MRYKKNRASVGIDKRGFLISMYKQEYFALTRIFKKNFELV